MANDRAEIYFFNNYYINIVQTMFFPRCRIRLLWERDRVGCHSAIGGRKNVRHAGSIGTFGDAARPGHGQEVTESKTVSCIGMPFIGYIWYKMNVFASGSDYRRLDIVRRILVVGDGEVGSVSGFLSFSLDGTSSRGCVSGIVEVKEFLNKRRHALNMCKR